MSPEPPRRQWVTEPLSRRTVVAGLAAIGSGCAALGSPSTPTATPRPDRDDDGIPDGADDYPTDAQRGIRTFRMAGTTTLDPGDFQAVALTNEPDDRGEYLHYRVTVGGDTPVDCLVFERDAYDTYEDGARDVPVVSRLSRTGVTDTDVTVRLDRGEYLFALDYTMQGTAPGPDSVEVELLVELADPPDGRTA